MNTMKLDSIKPSSSPDDAPPAVNYPQLTVSELALTLKRTLETTFGYVRLRGEVSGYRGPHASGHAYFSLKDASARIDAVIWKTVFARMPVKPEEGMEILASGKISSFPAKSSYQIVIDTVEPAGAGALMAVLEARRRKLAEEGLFDQSRKKPLPYLPRVIGVVTSPSGAVIRDIIHRLADRFASRVVIWPVRVQGDGAGAEIAAAIRGMNAAGETFPKPDVLIVARGGGSLEDLWSFNDEDVVRAAADSHIPLISAVGHETDWTLLDHVADVRAPTPTAAAELCVPVWSDLALAVREMQERKRAASLRLLAQHSATLRALARMLPSLRSPTLNGRQRLDGAGDALQSGLKKVRNWNTLTFRGLQLRLSGQSPRSMMSTRIERLKLFEIRRRSNMDRCVKALQGRLESQFYSFDSAREKSVSIYSRRLSNISARWLSYSLNVARKPSSLSDDLIRIQSRLRRSIRYLLERNSDRASKTCKMLEAVNYLSILNRGFALVIDQLGNPITAASTARKARHVDLRFHDGNVAARIDNKITRKTRGKDVSDLQQRTLF
jgi:exodeoxyribonuclease VII large subunit